MLQPGQCPPGQGIRPSRPGWVVGWWTGDTVLSPPTDFFRQGLPRAAFNEAPMVDHAEPPVLLQIMGPMARGCGEAQARLCRAASMATRRSCMSRRAGPSPCLCDSALRGNRIVTGG